MNFRGAIRFLFFIYISVSVLGCGKRPELFVDPSLEPYVVQFVDEVERLGYAIPRTAISVKFDDVSNTSLYATCVTSEDEATIKVNPDRWPVSPDQQALIEEYFVLLDSGQEVPDELFRSIKRSLMDGMYVIFHEMLHCSFNLGHDQDPFSLLYAYFVEVDDLDDLIRRLAKALI